MEGYIDIKIAKSETSDIENLFATDTPAKNTRHCIHSIKLLIRTQLYR